MLDKFIIHVLKSFMGIFPAVHFTSDKKNSQLFTFTGITRGISASKRRTIGMFTVINLSLCTQILRHKDWVKSN